MDKITNLYNEVKNLIENAKTKAIKAVDFGRVLLYWSIGEKIYNEVQQKKHRADYGKQLIKNLSKQLEPIYGSGYSYRQLYLFLQFYKTFEKVNTLYSQLSWSHYKLLIRIEDQDKREFYLHECKNSLWSVRQLERQINSALFENPTIGVLLCADKNDLVVQYSLPQDNKTIKASKYELILPDKNKLLESLKKTLKLGFDNE